MSEIDPEDDVTDDNTTEIAPHEVIGSVHVYPDNVIFWVESKSNVYFVITSRVFKKGSEHGSILTIISTIKSNALPPSISIS